MRWDETWHRLIEWTSGQGPSERLAAQVLLEDGFTGLDPSHPLGGRDGKKDAVAWRSNEKWIMAVYFPRGKKPFNEVKAKLVNDFVGVASNKAEGLAFVTNQELSLGERSELQESVPGRVEIYHLERITTILDKPAMRSVRAQFLGIGEKQDRLASSPVFVRIIPRSFRSSTDLIGRTPDLVELSRFLNQASSPGDTPNVIVITGMPGVGKTALALQAASSSVAQEIFLGGAIAIDFNGYALDPDDRVMAQQVLSSALLALGDTEVQSDPALMFVRFQSFLEELDASGKQILLFFDNVSQVDQIEPIIPRSGKHRVIVTSRNSLAPRLGSPRRINLEPLTTPEGIDLLMQASHSSDAGLERLAVICAGLPIALQLVGQILRNEEALTPSELADELSFEQSRLEGLEFEDSTIRAIFQGSYARLSKFTRACFRYISAHPGPEFSVDSIAAMLGGDRLQVRRAFRSLEGSHLIVRTLDKPTWTIHDLLRLYSTELFGIEDGASAGMAALSLLYGYYFTTAEQANEWMNASGDGVREAFQSVSDARSWMSTEVAGITASVDRSSRSGDYFDAYRLGITIGMYLGIIGDTAAGLTMAEAALSAARALHDAEKEAGALNNVGLALNNLRRFSEAKGIFIEATKKYRSIGDKSGEAKVLVGLCEAMRAEGSIQETVGPLRRAVRLSMEVYDLRGAGIALTNLGITFREGGNFAEAIESLSLALKAHNEVGAQ
jgi:tetratricopeptide (TPR) repeat protein